MASYFYILDLRGDPIIYRSFRGELIPGLIDIFKKCVLDEEDTNVAPVFEHDGRTFVYIRVNDVYLLLVSCTNICPLMQIAFLRSCVSTFTYYYKNVSEESIKDNFVIVYELIDEMCDFGYPQLTEERVLKQMITQEGLISSILGNGDTLNARTLPTNLTGMTHAKPWRPPEKTYYYRRNEIFIDVVESVNMQTTNAGIHIKSTQPTLEIIGKVLLRVRLSGMPVVIVGTNEIRFGRPLMTSRSVHLDSVKFHRCVELAKFDVDRSITFVPPDGNFELLSYRVQRTMEPPVEVSCITTCRSASKIVLGITVQTQNSRWAHTNFIDVLVPIPAGADTPVATTAHGVVRYAPESNQLLWSLRKVKRGVDVRCEVVIHFPSVMNAFEINLPPIQIKFEVPYYVPSGFKLRYVKVEEKYEAVPWVRYKTQSGTYEIRIK